MDLMNSAQRLVEGLSKFVDNDINRITSDKDEILGEKKKAILSNQVRRFKYWAASIQPSSSGNQSLDHVLRKDSLLKELVEDLLVELRAQLQAMANIEDGQYIEIDMRLESVQDIIDKLFSLTFKIREVTFDDTIEQNELGSGMIRQQNEQDELGSGMARQQNDMYTSETVERERRSVYRYTPAQHHYGQPVSPTQVARNIGVLSCPICGKAYHRRADLDRHLRIVHRGHQFGDGATVPDRDHHWCGESGCDRSYNGNKGPFHSRDHLVEHIRNVHGRSTAQRRVVSQRGEDADRPTSFDAESKSSTRSGDPLEDTASSSKDTSQRDLPFQSVWEAATAHSSSRKTWFCPICGNGPYGAEIDLCPEHNCNGRRPTQT